MAVPAQQREPLPLPLSAQLLGQMADTLAWPLLMLGPDARLLHANLAARRLLASGHPLLQAANGSVQVADAARQAALADALSEAACQGRRVVLRWAGGGGRQAVSLTLAPMPAGRHHGRDGRGTAPVLLAITVADDQAADLPAFAARHGLSAAEGRLLPRLALADSSVQAAAALRLPPATVRSQAARLRRKTGHRSVADLVRALHRLPPTAPLPAQQATMPVPAGRHLPAIQVNPDLAQRHG